MNLNEKVSAAKMAEACDLQKSQLNNLAASGVLRPVGSPRQYPFKQNLHAYINFLRGRVNPTKQDDRELSTKKLKADAYYKTAKAAAAQIELAELEGTMHSAEDVQAFAEQFTYGIRSMLTALPGRVAVDVSHAKNAAEAAEIIKAEINKVLSVLSEYQYDPEFFSTRVKDRRGWMGLIGDYTGAEGSKP